MTKTFGLTSRQTYNLYRSIRKRVFKEWCIPADAIAFTARYYIDWPLVAWDWNQSIADTHFCPLTHVPFGISVNQHFLDYLHEDEVEHVLLHEIAHIIAGWDADHGDKWAWVCGELGTPPVVMPLFREWRRTLGTPMEPAPEHIKNLQGIPSWG